VIEIRDAEGLNGDKVKRFIEVIQNAGVLKGVK